MRALRPWRLPILVILFCLAARSLAAQTVITTIAGGAAPTNGPALLTFLGPITGVAEDGSGNLYAVTPTGYVYKIDTAGNLTILAGNGSGGYSGDMSVATSGILNRPQGIAVDAGGFNVYIADTGNNVIRVISGGVISTFAGNGARGNGCADGTAPKSCPLNQPQGVFVDATNSNVYIADTNNHVIRQVSGGQIKLVAGNGTEGFNGDAAVAATLAQLDTPSMVWVDGSKNIFIADTNNQRIREVTFSTGQISTVAGGAGGTGSFGQGTGSFSGDGGLATAATLNQPSGVFVSPMGHIFIADTNNNVIREVTAVGGNISTIAGNSSSLDPVNGSPLAGFTGDGGAATSATLSDPFGVVGDASNNLFIADTINHRLRQINAMGTINTIAGNGVIGDFGLPTSASLALPYGAAVDTNGNLFITDYANDVVREVPSGTQTIVTAAGTGIPGHAGDGGTATNAQLNFPQGIAVGSVFFADSQNFAVRDLSGSNLSTVVGTLGAPGFSMTGGPAATTPVTNVEGVAEDASGNLYIADPGAHAVWKLDSTHTTLSVFAGSPGLAGYAGDGSPANMFDTVLLNAPGGVAVDKATGTVYIADTKNNVIRVVSPAGIINTFAGTGTRGFLGDGSLAVNAELDRPEGVAVDSMHNVYIADTGNNVVREVDVSGSTLNISTVVGNTSIKNPVTGAPLPGFSGDAGSPTSAQLSSPIGLSFSPTAADILYIADAGNNRIRARGLAGAQITLSATNLMFPATAVGQLSPPQTLTITNPGTMPLQITGITVLNSPGSFRLPNAIPQWIQPGQSFTFPVIFEPSTTGGITAQLSISDNAPGSPQTVGLVGTGTPPAGCTNNWIGGATGRWLATPASMFWSKGTAPDMNDTACIMGNVVVTLDGTANVLNLFVDGSLTIGSGGALTLGSSSSSATIQNLTLNGGTLNGQGTVVIGDTFTSTGGTLGGPMQGVTILGTATITTAPLTDGGIVRYNGATTLTGTTLNVVPVFPTSVGPTGTFTMQGTSMVAGPGGSVFLSLGTISIPSGSNATIGPTVQNSGHITVGSGTLTLSQGLMNTGSTLVSANGTLNLNGSSTITGVFGDPGGTGAVNVGGSVNFAVLSPAPASIGTLNIGGGSVILSGTTLAATTVNLTGGGSLQGIGTIQGNVVNTSGTVIPFLSAPGLGTFALTIAGSYTQMPGGTLSTVISSLVAGTGYSQLAVTGTATLGGTLNAGFTFNPVVGNSFAVVRAGTVSGTFATVIPSTVSGGLTVMPSYPAAPPAAIVNIGAAAPPMIIMTTLPAGAAGVPYGADIQISGGLQPLTFAVTSPALTGGFTMTTTGSGNVQAGHVFNALPAMGTITFGVMVTDAASNTVSATITLPIGAAPANAQPQLLKGQYALLFQAFSDSNGDEQGITGSLNFDGISAVTGTVDINSTSAVSQMVAVTGTYSVGPDNRGFMTLTAAGMMGNFYVAMSVGNVYRGVAYTVRLTQFNDYNANDRIGSGFLRLQDTTAFTKTSVAGTYVSGLTGQGPSPGLPRVAQAMLIMFDNMLNVTSGSGDFNSAGTLGSFTLTGTYTAPDANGRMVLTLTITPGGASTAVVYIISANEAIVMTLDPRATNDLLIGSAWKQPSLEVGNFSNASLAGPDVVRMLGRTSGSTDTHAIIGLATTSAGSLTINFDENKAGTVLTNQTCSGPYNVAMSGRASAALAGPGCNGGSGGNNLILYFAQTDRGFVITDGSSAGAGVVEPQMGVPFAPSPFNSTNYFGEQETVTPKEALSGIATVPMAGTFNITSDDSHAGGDLTFGQIFMPSFTVASNGHFTSPASGNNDGETGYVTSPFELTFFSTGGSTSNPSPSSHPDIILGQSVPAPPGTPSPAGPSVNFPTPVAVGMNAQSMPMTITNTGLGPLGIMSVNASGSPDFSASGTCVPVSGVVVVLPQGTCTVIITFAPTGTTSLGTMLSETLILNTDGTGNGKVTFTLTGTATGAGCTKTFAVASGAWETGANWAPAGMPGSGDTACVLPGYSAALNSTQTIAGLDVLGTLNGGATGVLTVTGTSSLSGTISGNITVTFAGLLTWTGGTISATGTLMANGGINISGTGTATLSGVTLTSTGHTVQSGTATLDLENGAVFTQTASAIYDAQSTFGILTSSTGTFNNAGTFQRPMGSAGGAYPVNVPFNNTGTVNVIISELDFNAGMLCAPAASCNGPITVSGILQLTGTQLPNAMYNLGGSITINSGGEMNGVGGGTVNFVSGASVSGAGTFFIGDTTTVATGAVLGNAAVTVISGGTLRGTGTLGTMGGPLTNLTMGGGTIHPGASPGTLTVNGNYTQTGGTLSIDIGPTAASFSQLVVNGTAKLGGVLNINQFGGFIQGPNQKFIVVLATAYGGGTFLLNPQPPLPASPMFGIPTYSAAPTGVVLTTGGAAPCTKTFGVTSGTYETAGNWIPSGIPASTDYVCVPAGNSATLSSAPTVAGLNLDGTLTLNAGSGFTVNGPTNISATGVLTGATGASPSFTSAGTFTLMGGQITGTVVVSGNSGTTIVLNGGTIAAAQVGSNGTLNITASTTIQNGAILTAFIGSTANLSSTASLLSGAGTGQTFVNSGTLNKLAGGAGGGNINVPFNNTGTVMIVAGTTLNLAGGGISTGTFTVPAGSTLGFIGGGGGGPTFNIGNGGTLNGGGSVFVSSILNFQAGSSASGLSALTISGATALVVLANGVNLGASSVTNGGTLAGTGTVIGDVTSSGLVQVGSPSPALSAGVLTINGNYTQNAQGVLGIELGGTTPKTGYGQLAVSGVATLNGLLGVGIIGGFAPAAGDAFALLLDGSVSGTFTSQNLPSPPSGSLWNVTYPPASPGGVVLTATPTAAPMISAAPNPLPFGNQPQGVMSSALTLTFTNPGSGTLTITGGLTPMGGNAGDFQPAAGGTCGAPPFNVTPGPGCTVKYTFTPSMAAAESTTLQVANNSATNPYMVTLNGMGILPTVTFTPTAATVVNFGAVSPGTPSATQTVMLSVAAGTGTLQLSSISIAQSGVAAPDFAFAAGTNCPTTGGAVTTSCVVVMTFTPSMPATENATLTFQGSNLTGSPVVFQLTGIGASTAAGFTFTATSPTGGNGATVSILPGDTATFTLVIQPNPGFIGPITVACMEIPAIPATILTTSPATTINVMTSPSGPITVTCTLQTNCVPALVGPRAPWNVPGPWTPAPLAEVSGLVLLLAMLCRKTARGSGRRSRSFGTGGVWAQRVVPVVAACVLVLLVMTWTACVSNPPAAIPNAPTTPAGAYQIQVVATAPGPAGQPPVKQTVSLTVHIL